MASTQPRVRADERRWRYCDVSCERCGAVVAVTKFSQQHTSLQWSAEAVLRCAEFGSRVAAGQSSALVPTCVSLRASIDNALADGRLAVSEP